MKRIFSLLVLVLVLLFMSSCVTIDSKELPAINNNPTARPDTTVTPSEIPDNPVITQDEGGRTEPFTEILGNGQDVVTVMLYMCGSDLESFGGLATADLYELMSGTIGPNVNVIVETGGAKEWKNAYVSNSTNQRFKVESGKMTLVQDNLGKKNMTSPQTLSDFISFCAENYPANRNILILWDHGGGSLSGFGYDEFFESGSMMLDDIKQALDSGGVKFELVGFDACLMSTAEMGFVIKDYADYMIASQKLEPGCGWYYTNWISELSANSSMPTIEVAKTIIDDFVEISRYEDYSSETTLALIDLTEMDNLFVAMKNYFNAANEMLLDGDFADMSRVRADAASGSRSTGGTGFRARNVETDYDHVDLVYLAKNLKNSYSNELISAVNHSVKYFSYGNTTEVHGLTIYFPYYDLSYFNTMVDLYARIGLEDDYISFISSFISVMLGGQAAAGNTDEDWSAYEWYDNDLVDVYGDEYGSYGNYEGLEVWLKDDNYVLSLSDEDWDIVVGIEIQVYLDDDEGGYIELGSDNIYEFDDDGDLKILFDNTWLAVDGQTICFYNEFETVTEDGFWYTYGSSPVYLNGELCDIIVMWDSYNPYGYIAGARFHYDGTISQKGYTPLQDGDVLQFICDYYLYDGSYDDWYYFNDEYVIYGTPELSYEDIGYGDCMVYYMLTDIYGNHYWTEPVLFYD